MRRPPYPRLLAMAALSAATTMAALPARAEPVQAEARAAPPTVSLSAQDAVRLALEASQDRYAQGLAAAAAERDLENAWNLFLPSVSAGLSAALSDELFFPARTASAQGPFGTSVTLGTRVSLSTGVLFDLEKRRTDYLAASLVERESAARVARDAEKAYFLIASLGLELENKAKAAALAAERLRLAELRFERGLGSELDALRARMSERNARTAQEKAAGDYRKRLASLRRLLGLDPDVPLRLTTPIETPEPTLGADLDRFLAGRLDLERSRLALVAASTATRRYVAVSRLPLVTLEAGWNMSLADFTAGKDGFSLGAALSFNVDAWIPNSRKDLELESLREAEGRQSRKLEQDRLNARTEVEGLILDLELSRKSLDAAEGQVALAERIYARTREAYERGSATALELEDAQYATDTARQALVSGRYQYLALLIDLGYALSVDWRELAR